MSHFNFYIINLLPFVYSSCLLFGSLSSSEQSSSWLCVTDLGVSGLVCGTDDDPLSKCCLIKKYDIYVKRNPNFLQKTSRCVVKIVTK